MNASSVVVGDRVIVARPGKPRFGLAVDSVHVTDSGATILTGRQIMVGNPLVFCGDRRKVGFLRAGSTVETY